MEGKEKSIVDSAIDFFVDRDRSDWWGTSALFFLTALVLYRLFVYKSR